ncbi:hypothetical protein F441_05061 [Phytophthora nicotianae CJ01A1]|uniref:Uncharacterized protein n=7 Tax=Phytophthora nicotianae TaxID=4792 RepID=W2QGZ6_PHYN3|nr:hypothetical protein PPTG_09271 [Phytophthora nicotianae INRA-310]ETI51708.1 hypothetical protein F443_05055 [Phytophthora nicotianae P1569]ETK91533.1 hypothetical protein L915_04926 [Phytophthora nicotianae]ETO80460.1 hypothetical protein F444_05104 [Phytophthora nicotianae P1976]ETP21492.1 hypothetical protein F441_05061 [Phytophthora nicotianae CJ01A1]ETP49342.1 hypothetical protein F442_05122 [Phytophthora nicotianae P10297]KUF96822.1 hypothetical protein AM588_10007955 [Phytophthora n
MAPQATVALTPILKKLVPLCFVTGAAMELFMVKTGFYDIVTVTEAERRQQRDEERREYMETRSRAARDE